MTVDQTEHERCVIIGASHAGVNVAFNLRQEGWAGEILLLDGQEALPYHRPPLSKTLLYGEKTLGDIYLKPDNAYINHNIHLKLGTRVESIDPKGKRLSLNTGGTLRYDKLVLSTGATPFVPPIEGLDTDSPNVFVIRTESDIAGLRRAASEGKTAAIIGGGYIGLEVASSLKKLGVDVVIFEREERLLSRVTSPVMSEFFKKLHEDKGAVIHTSARVESISGTGGQYLVNTDSGRSIPYDMVIIGTGIKPDLELAYKAGLGADDGILVDPQCKTSEQDIWAGGDCTRFFSKRYNQRVRLESVQNAVDQAKVVAASICGKEAHYDPVPWFWSDQFDVKLQIAGLSTGYTDLVIRKNDERHFSVWYFRSDRLLSVDAVNDSKAYVAALKAIRADKPVKKDLIPDLSYDLKSLV